MKEYIAETGGRYTYSDDVLNLQELALSLTALFRNVRLLSSPAAKPKATRLPPATCGWVARSAISGARIRQVSRISFMRPTRTNRLSMPMKSINAGVVAICVPEEPPYRK